MAPRGRKAPSTRNLRPQISNLFVQTCVEEVENAYFAAPQEPLLSVRGEEHLDKELDPQAERVRGLQEEIGGKKSYAMLGLPAVPGH